MHTVAMRELTRRQSVRELGDTDSGVRTCVMRIGGSVCDVQQGGGAARGALTDEVRAAAAAAHPHIRPVMDCWTEDETLFVARHLAKGTLEPLVRGEHRLAAGAVVTLLAPIASAIGSCHKAGVTGVRLSPARILLTANGAPQLDGIGLRIEIERPTPQWLHESEGVAADVAEFIRLIRSVADDLETALTPMIEARDWRGTYRWLLASTAPVPLMASRAVVESRQRAQQPITRRQLHGSRRPTWLSRAKQLLRDLGQRVRPRYWAIAGAGAIACGITAVALGPWQPDGAEPDSAAVVAPTQMSGSSDSPASPDAMQVAATAAPAVSDEPVDAVETLLRQREECLNQAEDECLRAILMEGSLLFADDLAGNPSWRLPADASFTLHQELGDAVIVHVEHEQQPASVLAVNTEAGWVLREIWID